MSATKLSQKTDQIAISHLSELLDEALQETFPASDPVAVTIELELPSLGANSRTGMRSASSQPRGVSGG